MATFSNPYYPCLPGILHDLEGGIDTEGGQLSALSENALPPFSRYFVRESQMMNYLEEWPR